MSDSDTLALASALIARPSVTPDDAGCLELIGKRLAAAGFKLERIDVAGVANLWARRGTSPPLVCLAGHTDVVPTGPRERWASDPFRPEIRDGRLFGRGAADMKTSLAAFVTAVERFVIAHPDHDGSIALLLTSDEEGDSIHGTIEVCRALAARGEAIDFCIVGEPTSVSRLGDMIKNGRRGSLTGKLTVKGVQGHVAYPHLARNPIHLAAPALAELVATEWDTGDEHFPPTTWQVSNLHAGTGAGNVIPGSAEMQFNFRFAASNAPEALTARVQEVLERHGLDYDLQWTLGGKPYLTAPGSLVQAMAAAIRDTLDVEPELSTTGGTSDGRFIAEICRQVVEFGPVNSSIHKIDECIEVADIEPLSRCYQRTIENLLLDSAL
jgi:succinyl-diaminopimelate desuccinylase